MANEVGDAPDGPAPMKQPPPEPAYVRDGSGKFAPGTCGGQLGRRGTGAMQRRRKWLASCTSPQEFQRCWRRLVAQCDKGDVKALALYMAYVLGPPRTFTEVEYEERLRRIEILANVTAHARKSRLPMPDVPDVDEPVAPEDRVGTGSSGGMPIRPGEFDDYENYDEEAEE